MTCDPSQKPLSALLLRSVSQSLDVVWGFDWVWQPGEWRSKERISWNCCDSWSPVPFPSHLPSQFDLTCEASFIEVELVGDYLKKSRLPWAIETIQSEDHPSRVNNRYIVECSDFAAPAESLGEITHPHYLLIFTHLSHLRSQSIWSSLPSMSLLTV